MASQPHPSGSQVQQEAEAIVLELLGQQLGTVLNQGRQVEIGGSHMQPDGMAEDGSVAVEVFAHVGTLKGGQRHKVSTDALKLLAIREIHPGARLILAFVDEKAAASVSGWKAETFVKNGIELMVVGLDDLDRAKIQAAQIRQKMINAT